MAMAAPGERASIDERREWARQVLLASGTPDTDAGGAARFLVDLVDRLEAMLEHTSDMITVLGADGRVRYSNRAAGLLTGHSESVNDTPAFDLVHPEDQGAAAEALAQVLGAPGAEVGAELRIRHADGSWHYVDVYAKNCLDQPVAGVVVSMRDICRRKEAERSLSQANEAMRDFVAVASHDLRSPVAVISGLAATLVSGWTRLEDPARLEIAGMVASSAERMGRLIENLLTISQLGAGTTQRRVGVVRVLAAVRSAVHQAQHGAVGLEGVAVEVDPRLAVRADPDVLQRALVNYLDNARVHGAPPVSVGALERSGMVEIRVRDGGPGVPEELRDALFQRFARGSSGGGSGLGLSIVRDLARASGGEAWLEADPPEGECFCVSFPAADPVAPAEPERPPGPAGGDPAIRA